MPLEASPPALKITGPKTISVIPFRNPYSYPLSSSSPLAFKLFKEGKILFDTAIAWLRHNEALGEYSDCLLLLNLRRLMTINGDLVDEDFGLLEYTSSSPWLFWLFALVKAYTRVLGMK